MSKLSIECVYMLAYFCHHLSDVRSLCRLVRSLCWLFIYSFVRKYILKQNNLTRRRHNVSRVYMKIFFTSQGIVISYLYTILWQKAPKVWLEDACYDCYCLQTNQNDLFNLSSVDIHFSLSISTKNKFFLRNERSSVICSI